MEHILDVLAGIDPSSLTYALVVLDETNPRDPLIDALLLAVELIADRREWRADEVATMRAVSAEMTRQFGKDWSSQRNPRRRAEVLRRRYPPNGNPDEWVAGGAA